MRTLEMPLLLGQSLMLNDTGIKVTVESQVAANALCYRIRVEKVA